MEILPNRRQRRYVCLRCFTWVNDNFFYFKFGIRGSLFGQAVGSTLVQGFYLKLQHAVCLVLKHVFPIMVKQLPFFLVPKLQFVLLPSTQLHHDELSCSSCFKFLNFLLSNFFYRLRDEKEDFDVQGGERHLNYLSLLNYSLQLTISHLKLYENQLDLQLYEDQPLAVLCPQEQLPPQEQFGFFWGRVTRVVGRDTYVVKSYSEDTEAQYQRSEVRTFEEMKAIFYIREAMGIESSFYSSKAGLQLDNNDLYYHLQLNQELLEAIDKVSVGCLNAGLDHATPPPSHTHTPPPHTHARARALHATHTPHTHQST